MIYNDIVFGNTSNNEFNIDTRELKARLGADIDVQKQIDEYNTLAKYRFAYVKTQVNVVENSCDFGYIKIESTSLSKLLKGCNEVIIFGVTAGIDIDRYISKLHIQNRADAFVFDAIASAAVESFADYVNEKISEGFNCTKRFSPGYADFPIEFQSHLLERLDSQRTIGVALTEKLLMTPQKSITAVIGIKNEKH